MEKDFTKGIGLVLAGGGGKGAYQLGVLKALKEKGLLDEVTAISGASIGAVNAMLYAQENIDIMYKAWEEIDMLTLFDVELEMLLNNRPYFSRSEMLSLMEKFIDYDLVKYGKYKIYNSICKINNDGSAPIAEYRCLNDLDIENIKKVLLASTALPVIYEAVEIDGAHYRDGGICDNEPIKPLYDAGIREFIVIGLKHGKKINADKWPDANIIAIYPSRDLGDLVDGTLDFSSKSIMYREMLGYKDGLRSVKTHFEKDEMYINLEPQLALNDYNEVLMNLRTQSTIKAVESRVNSNINKFNEIANKYADF